MNEEIKKKPMEDPEDLVLKEVMGDHFQDLSHIPAPAPKGEKKPEPVSRVPTEKKTCKKAMDATWMPVKAESGEIQRLVNCAKGTVVYGGLSAVLFWWQQAGLLASEAAWPSFIVLALLAGLKIGSCATRR